MSVSRSRLNGCPKRGQRELVLCSLYEILAAFWAIIGSVIPFFTLKNPSALSVRLAAISGAAGQRTDRRAALYPTATRPDSPKQSKVRRTGQVSSSRASISLEARSASRQELLAATNGEVRQGHEWPACPVSNRKGRWRNRTPSRSDACPLAGSIFSFHRAPVFLCDRQARPYNNSFLPTLLSQAMRESGRRDVA